MSEKRRFRSPESYEAERMTRDMVPEFLLYRGFQNVNDERRPYGQSESQTIKATAPNGEEIVMRVRLCWYTEKKSTISAAQIRPNIKDGNWVETLNSMVNSLRKDGITHYLIVQRVDKQITYAALLPLSELTNIWCAQRDVSKKLMEDGVLGARKRNHVMNGSSPTIWLQDDAAPQVAAELWNHKGVQDLVKLKTIKPVIYKKRATDDTYDDLFNIDPLDIGSDNPSIGYSNISYVKRNQRVRKLVINRAKEKCEREGCGAFRKYSGFLDVHHILGAEKSDRVCNCVALCPNCHREAHMSPNRDEINKRLLEIAQVKTSRMKDSTPNIK